MNWELVHKMADWDHILRLTPAGEITETNELAPGIYSYQDDPNPYKIYCESEGWYFIPFDPAEFFEPQHYEYHLNDYLEDGETVEFYLTTITDLDDPEYNAGWALVYRSYNVLPE